MITKFEDTTNKVILNVHLTKWILTPTRTYMENKDVTTITKTLNYSFLCFSLTLSGIHN